MLASETIDLTDHEAAPLGERSSLRERRARRDLPRGRELAWGLDLLEHRVWRSMAEVNLMGAIHDRGVRPRDDGRRPQTRRGGQVSSAAGLLITPWHAAYSAAKFGIRGIAEVLRFDLAPYDIGVHLVCPGAVDTPLVGSTIAGVDRSNPEVAKTAAWFQRHAVTPTRRPDR